MLRFGSRLSVSLAAVIVLGVSPQPAVRASDDGWTPELMMTVKRVLAAVPSPDGRQVAFVVSEALMEGEKSEWLSQIHVGAADGSGSRQLTRGEKSATEPRWSPDGRWIGFLSSRNDKANVWRIRPDGGEAEMITDEKGGVLAFEWSPDGASLALVIRDPKTDAEEKADKEKRDWRTIDEQPKMRRLYVAPVEKGADGKRTPRVLTPAAGSVDDFSWSPDGTAIAFAHRKTPAVNDWPTSDLSQVTVADGTVKVLASGPGAEHSPAYSPDGRSIAFLVTDNPPTWARDERVHVMPAAGGGSRPLAETPDSQPDILGWSADGTRIIVSEQQRVRGRVLALGIDGGSATALDAGAISVATPALNRTGSAVGYVGHDFDRAPEAYCAPLAATLAGTRVSAVQPAFSATLGRSEIVTWPSPDGHAIEGLLTYPVGCQPGTRVPLLLVIHGGPAGVFVKSFIGMPSPYPVAVFAARGYAVLRANPRGSSGYGKEFRHANRADWGGGDYRDLMAGVDRVIAMGVADPERLGVMGWSYGGFMTSWVITQTRRFKAASAGAAVTNLMSFTGVTDIPGFVPNYFGGEYWDIFDTWRTHSAMFNVKGVQTPTLIQHGEADDRVPISQGYELYNALKRQGVTTKFTVYPRQPHGFIEPKMTLDAARANLEWFDRFVMKRPPATSSY